MKTQIQTRLPIETIDEFLKQRGWAWESLMRRDLPMTVEQIETYLVASDPALFAASFLKNPQTIPGSSIVRGEPLVLNSYQQESIRYKGDIITQDGAEIGKTLEITALTVHTAMTVKGASILIGAPEFAHLLEITDAIEDQLSLSPALDKSLWVHRRAPHYVIKSSIDATIYFIPAGHDGKAFRGKHVSVLAIFDEAAAVYNKRVWSEFFRARMPACRVRIYSVPNGRRDTEYYRIKEAARKAGDGVSIDQFRFLHRPKTIQPAPFWSKEREREMVEKFGSRHAPGYIHNVLGLDGEPENPVFPYSLWEKLIADIPEYRQIKIEADESAGTLRVEASRLSASASPSPLRGGGAEEIKKGAGASSTLSLEGRGQGEGDKSSSRLSVKTVYIADETHEIAAHRKNPQAVRSLISRFIPPPPPGLYYAGADFGKHNDPSEMVVKLKIGDVHRRVLRLHLRGLPYDIQSALMEALREVFNLKSFGMDMGSAGTAVLDIINSEYPALADILNPRLFNEKVDAMDSEGAVIENPKTGEPVRKAFREAFVNVLVQIVQRGQSQEPYDVDIINSFTSYTAREGQNGNLIFSKENDHIVDADVQAIGGLLALTGSESVCVGSAYDR